MADLTDIQSAEAVKIAGADPSGVETNFADVDASGNLKTVVSNFPATQPVSAAALPLPAGASTAANQTTANTSLSSIDTKTPALVSGRQPVDGSGVTQPVSGTVSANATLAAETTKVIGTVNLSAGQTLTVTNLVQLGGAAVSMNTGVRDAGTQRVTIATNDSVPVTGPLTDAQLRRAPVPVSGSVSLLDGTKESYSAAIVNSSVASNATDIFTITGSATKTIRVLRIMFTASQSTSAQRDVLFIKRSTANTGGTSTAPARIPHDSDNAAATATVLGYTANPTLGTAVGTVRAMKVFIGSTSANSDEFIAEFGTRPSQAIVLRGTSQVLAVNLNSVTSSGGLVSISVEWTEEEE